jgi:hypothetical protein
LRDAQSAFLHLPEQGLARDIPLSAIVMPSREARPLRDMGWRLPARRGLDIRRHRDRRAAYSAAAACCSSAGSCPIASTSSPAASGSTARVSSASAKLPVDSRTQPTA